MKGVVLLLTIAIIVLSSILVTNLALVAHYGSVTLAEPNRWILVAEIAAYGFAIGCFIACIIILIRGGKP